jgi:hypothetical protein
VGANLLNQAGILINCCFKTGGSKYTPFLPLFVSVFRFDIKLHQTSHRDSDKPHLRTLVPMIIGWATWYSRYNHRTRSFIKETIMYWWGRETDVIIKRNTAEEYLREVLKKTVMEAAQ